MPVEGERAVPERLGDFRLLRKLGAGGMGIVYAARQESMGRDVALKLIRPDQLYFPGARERFRREVEAISRLQHPGIVPVHLVGEEQGLPYFAMEWVRGCTLAEVLTELDGRQPSALRGVDLAQAVARGTGRHLDEELAVPDSALFAGTWTQCCFRIAAAVARTLHHAHRQGVMHRDVKPSNILISHDGRVLLLDFGVASTHSVDRITRTGSQVGSLPYMSPEQLRGRSHDIDARSDVYSLGVALYELLTLRLPFLAGDVEGTRRAILEGRPEPPRQRNPSLGRDAETVCLEALERDKARRYGDAEQFARDLENVLQLRPVEARRPGLALRGRRFAQRHPTLSVACVLGFLLLVVVPSGGAWFWKRQRDELAEAEFAAREQARIASATTDFVVSVFEKADPMAATGEELTLRETVDQAVPKVREELADQPRVQLRLLRTFARIYSNLGSKQSSRALLEEALALVNEREGPRSVEAADLTLTIATTRTTEGHYAEALVLLGEALEIGAEHGWDHVEGTELSAIDRERQLRWLARLHRGRADALFNLGRHEEAEDAIAASIRAGERLGVFDSSWADSYLQLGTLYLDQRRFDEATRTFERGVALYQRHRPEGSLAEVRLRSRLAHVQFARQEYAAAEGAYAGTFARLVEIGQDQHSIAAELLHNWASLLFDQRRLAEAEQKFRASHEIYRGLAAPQRTGEADPVTVSHSRLSLAQCLCDLGRFAEAKPLAEQNVRSYLVHDDVRIDGLAMSRTVLGRCLAGLGEADRARESFSAALATSGGNVRIASDAHHQLGRLALEEGDAGAARRHLERGLDLRRQVFPENHWSMAVVLGLLGEAYRELAEPELAEPKLIASYEILRDQIGASAPQTIAALRILIEFYEDQDALERVDELWELLPDSSRELEESESP